MIENDKLLGDGSATLANGGTPDAALTRPATAGRSALEVGVDASVVGSNAGPFSLLISILTILAAFSISTAVHACSFLDRQRGVRAN